jgi:two-component system LytT family response regulator
MKKDFLEINNKTMMFKLPLTEIIHIESEGMTTYVHTTSGDRHKCCKNIGAVEEELNGTKFLFRTHSSHIINLTTVKVYNKEDGNVEIANGRVVPVAKRRKPEFIKAYKNFLHSRTFPNFK